MQSVMTQCKKLLHVQTKCASNIERLFTNVPFIFNAFLVTNMKDILISHFKSSGTVCHNISAGNLFQKETIPRHWKRVHESSQSSETIPLKE